MNEDLIKGLVKLKLELVDSILGRLPEKEAEQVRELGRLVLEALNEHSSASAGAKKTEDSNGIKKIDIE